MKALLILVGGRPLPNMLTVIHEKPEIIVAICSQESVDKEWPPLKSAITRVLPSCAIIEPTPIDAVEVEEIQNTCEQEVLKYPDAHWILNVTTATSLMTLGAYKAAERCREQFKIPTRCWYLDTAKARVKSLVGEGPDKDLFSIKVDQYVAAYNYGLQDGSSYKQYRKRYLEEDWLAIAKRLGSNPQDANLLKQIISEVRGSPRKGQIIDKPIGAYTLLQDLEAGGLLDELHQDSLGLHFILSEEQYKFLNGAWLELYVYLEAKSMPIFDDHVWHKEIIDNDPERRVKFPLQYNELDVAVTYKAQLLIAECKTGRGGLDAQTLDDIVTVSDLLGRGFVIKVLATNQSVLDSTNHTQETAYKDFITKATRKGIRVVPREELPIIREILEKKS